MSISPSESYTDMTKRETKAHGQTAFPAACYQVPFPETEIAVHWHSELEVIYVENGPIRLHVGPQSYLLHTGMGAFINSNILHTTEANSRHQKSQIQSVVFSARLVGGSKDSIYWSKYLFPILNNTACPSWIFSPDIPWQKKVIDNILDAWEAIASERTGYEFSVRNALSGIIQELDTHQKQISSPLSRKMLHNEQRIKKMLCYIQDHFFEPITLTDIADAASVSKSECIRCFQSILNTTPMQYVNHYRLQVAAQYLSGTDWQISEIGYRCGFTEMGYFSSRFKKQYGVTPTAYRNYPVPDV